MATLFDYLNWRGDLSFNVDPPHETDNYLISKIGCPDLTGLVPSNEREVALKEVVGSFRAQTGNNSVSLGVLASPYVMDSFYRLPTVPRFKSLMLSGFRRNNDLENAEQFSALTIRLSDGTHMVTFRGTDDNIFAWKENFQMAIMDAIPAQKDALNYLLWAMEAYDGNFIVCGHSKGGNLAVYAASMVPANMQDRIISVYSFDGPGFQDVFLKEEGYMRILPKVHSLIPQNSIVGILLSSGKKPEIVTSNCFGIRAHDGFTWETLGTRFVRTKALSSSSTRFKKAINETLSSMSLQDREAFIEEFFQVMTSTGAFTLTDLTEAGLRNSLELVRSLGRDKQVQKFAFRMISNTLADLLSKKKEY